MSAPPAVAPLPVDRTTLPVGAWTTVALLWLSGGSNYLTRTMLTTMRGSVIAEIHMTDAQFGLLTSSFLWVYAFACPLGGYMADRFSRRSVIIWSLSAWTLLTLATAYVHTFEMFALLRAALGLSQAFYVPAAVAMIVDYHLGPTRALASGVHLTGMIFGAMTGGLGGWLAEHHGWSYAYLAVGYPSLAICVLLILFLRNPPLRNRAGVDHDSEKSVQLKGALYHLLRPGRFYFLLACMSVQGAISWIIIAWMPTVIREQFNLGQSAAGFSSLGFLYAWQTTGLLAGGVWSDRWSATNERARILIPGLAIVLAAPVFFLTGWFHHIAFTFMSLSVWGLAMGFLGGNTMPIICLVVDERYRATAMGLLNGCTAIMGGLAIYGIGALRDAKVEFSMILTITGVGVLLCGSLLLALNRSLRLGGTVASATG